MKVNIEFIFSCESDDWKIQKLVLRMTNKLKKYQTGDTWVFKRVYLIEQDNELYHEVSEMYKKYRNHIDFRILEYTVESDEDEINNAVAFIPIWPDEYCQEYDDVFYEYKKCDCCGASEKSEDILYVQPTGSIKKDDFKMLSFERLDEIVLLPKLVEKLIEEGVSKEYFQPVLSKRKKIMGYTFANENIMPIGCYKDLNYQKTMICGECNAHCYHKNQDIIFIEKKWLKKEAAEIILDVNCTFEYYDGHRIVLLSPKVKKIISKFVKNAAFIPVFIE